MLKIENEAQFADFETRRFYADAWRESGQPGYEPSPEEYALEEEFETVLDYEASLCEEVEPE